jgi:Holliday junction DNA helicase RuvA
MIGQLRGVLSSKKPPRLLLDVNGVGYEVEAPMSTFYTLPEPGQTIQLLIHTHVREDALQLYGFASASERELFRMLIKVSGVGARLALTILSGIEVKAFVQCVQSGDSTSLTRLPGVGKKTAERLIVEMKDRLNRPTGFAETVSVVNQAGADNPVEDAVTALISLGYKPPEASRMVRSIPDVENAGTTEDLIRLALKAMVR